LQLRQIFFTDALTFIPLSVVRTSRRGCTGLITRDGSPDGFVLASRIPDGKSAGGAPRARHRFPRPGAYDPVADGGRKTLGNCL